MLNVNEMLEKLQKNIYRDTVINLVNRMSQDIQDSQAEMQIVKAQWDILSDVRTMDDLHLFVKMSTLNERSQLQAELLAFIKDELEQHIEQE